MTIKEMESICEHCQFVLHCGCRDDDHDYKLEQCGYYELNDRYQRLLQRLHDYVDRYEGGSTHDSRN